MLNLISAEWLKLTRRPLVWVLLAVSLAMFLLQMGGALFIAVLGSGILAASQVEEYRRQLVFPGIFGSAFAHINGLGGVLAIILAAGVMGSEYSWGTLRTQLARHPNRSTFLLAKLATLLLLLAVAIVLTLLVAAVAGFAMGALLREDAPLATSTLLMLPLAAVRSLFVFLPYMLLTLCFTIYGRSLLLGIGGGMLYLVFDIAIGTLVTFAQLGGVWRMLFNLILQGNILTITNLNSRAFGLQSEAISANLDLSILPSPLQATLVIALYSGLFLATALHFLVRRDVSGPS